MPQKRISICTSVSVGSRRAIVVDASGDVALAAENAFALYMASEYGFWSRRRYAEYAILYADCAILLGPFVQIRTGYLRM